MRQRLTAYATIFLLEATPGSASGEDRNSYDFCKPNSSEDKLDIEHKLEITVKVSKAVENTYMESGIILFAGFPDEQDLGSVVRYVSQDSYWGQFLKPLPGQKSPRVQVYSLHPRENGYALVFPGGSYLNIPNKTIPESFCADPIVTYADEASKLIARVDTDIIVVHPKETVPEIHNPCYGGHVFYVPIEPEDRIREVYSNIFSFNATNQNLWPIRENQRQLNDLALHGDTCKSLIDERYERIRKLNPNTGR